MSTNDWYYLGRITKTHGVNGEVVIHTQDGLSDIITKRESVFIELNKELVPFFLTTYFEMHDDLIVVAFEDIETPEQAKFILQTDIYIPKSELPKQKGKKLLDYEINGYTVIDKEKGPIGIVNEIMHSNFQSLLVVFNDKKEILIPIDDSIVLDVDRKKKIIHVDLPDGLLELND